MIRMEEVYLVGVIIVLCIIFIFIARYLRKEGFYGEINTHAKFNEYNKNRFNEIGYALNVTDTLNAMKATDTVNVSGAKKKLRNLGPDIQGIVGNIESTMDAKGKKVDRINSPYSVPNAELSPVLKSIRMCEKVVTAKCSAFDDPSFSNTCGLCMDIGTNSMADKSVGGLLLLPKEKKFAKDNQKGNFLPNYIPTVGTCPAGFFVATKDECLRLEKQLQCQKSSTFNSPDGCSQCYGDSSYSIVDGKYDADLIRGSGSLYIIGVGILEYNEVGQNNKGIVNLTKMTDPYIINLMGGEMTTINLYLKKAIVAVPYSETTIYNIDDMVIFERYIYTMVEGANSPGYAPNRPGDTLWNKEMPQSEYVPPPPNYLAGYLSGGTSEESTFTFDMFRLIQTDTLSGRKPRAVGSMNMKNPSGSDDVEVTKMGPIYGKKEMKLVMKAPFTFVDPFSQEASQCAGSPFVTKPESARLLASDSCYKKGSGPGTYGMACLQAMFLNNGCTELGKGYPKDNNTMTAVMYDLDGKPLNLQAISDVVYSKAVTTSTGLDSDGKQLSIKKWSEASVFCTGVAITSPCDIGNKDEGPLSTDCLEYLWDNRGENKRVGNTYNIMSVASSLFNAGMNNRFCTKAGTMSPRYDDGTDNLAAINYWQTKGGVAAVKSLMANIHYDANSDLVPEESKKDKLMQCYGIVPNKRPSYTNKFQPDSSLQTVLKPPLRKKAAAGGDGGGGDGGAGPATLICLSHHWTNDTPHVLMSTNGKDWYVPNIPIRAASTRLFITKLRKTYYAASFWGMNEGEVLYSSTDGKNWQPMGPANSRLKDHIPVGFIAFKNKLYIGMYDKGFFTSNDAGNTWTPIDIYASHLSQMKIINNKLYLVNRYSISEFNPSNNTSKQISPNFLGGNSSINCLDYDPDTKTYMIICSLPDQGDTKAKLFYWSNDLVTWSDSTGNWYTGKYSGFYNLTKAFGKWWVNGQDSSLLVCSNDGGKSWNEVKAPVQSLGNLFFFGKTLYYLGRDDPKNQCYTTTDGITWQKVTTINSQLNGGYLHMNSIA
jgi:hypothetical protein